MRAKDELNPTAKRQRGGGVKSFLVLLAGLGLLATAVLGVGGYLGYREAKSPGPADTATIVLLEPGSAVSTIAYTLQDAGVVRNAEFFTAVVRMRRAQSALKAGEYEVPARASLMDIIDLLIDGKSIQHFFTAPEGLTTPQILRLIAADQTLVTEITLSPAEGELLPETYAFTRGETRDEIIRRMMKSQDALIDEIWNGRAMELPFSTPAEAIILASIVEKETGVADERTRIAAVFINRLKRNMRLESDPTIIYGLTKGEPLGRGLRQSELRGHTPYNTYVIRGLPPTPIGNPGRAAIEAVLHPAETNELFFVADGSGGHVFSSNNRDHERNVAQWRRVERERRQGG